MAACAVQSVRYRSLFCGVRYKQIHVVVHERVQDKKKRGMPCLVGHGTG